MKVAGIIILLFVLICIGVNLYINNMLKCKIVNIKFYNIEQTTFLKFLSDDKKEFMLNSEEEKNISLEPQKYKFVNITCNITNAFPVATYDIQAVGHFDDNLSKIIVGKKISMESGDGPINIEPRANTQVCFNFIINAEGKAEQEIINYIRKSKFMLIGKNGPFTFKYNIQQKYS